MFTEERVFSDVKEEEKIAKLISIIYSFFILIVLNL